MKELKHFVYKTTNLLTGEYYYGKHSGYEDDDYLGSGLLLNKDIEKFGIEHFNREILTFHEDAQSAFDAEEATITQDMVENPMCYNMILGGGSFGNDTISILQVDFLGKLVKEWESISEASKYYPNKNGKIDGSIGNCLIKNQKSAKGFQWFYKYEVEDLNDIKPINRDPTQVRGNSSNRKYYKNVKTNKFFNSTRAVFRELGATNTWGEIPTEYVLITKEEYNRLKNK